MNMATILKAADTAVKVTTLTLLAAKAAALGLIMYNDHQKNKASSV